MKANNIETITGIAATGTTGTVIDATTTVIATATATGIVTTIVTTTDIARIAGIKLGEYGPNMWSGRSVRSAAGASPNSPVEPKRTPTNVSGSVRHLKIE
jgi:hypothetical protein